MRSQSQWNSLYRIFGSFQWMVSTAVILFSGLLKIDVSKLKGALDFFVPSVTWIQSNAWWSILTLTALGGLAKLANSRIGAPWVWEHVHFILDKYQELIFEGEEGAVHHHRVTLFKYVHCQNWAKFWDRRGGLIAVERSGHTTMKSAASFKAPDNADEAEGIAGWTWAAKRVITLQKLPDIHTNRAENHRLKHRAKYSKDARVSLKWLDEHPDSARARSLCGIPVEVKGRIWGVIVIDSRSETFRNLPIITSFWKINGRYFGKLLERA